MRCLFFAPLVAACTPGSAPLEPWHGDDDGTPYLGETHFPTVTRLYDEPGEARLLHDGPPLPPAERSWSWDRELTVVEAGDALRVSWSGHGVQLLLWLPRSELVDAVAAPTTGTGAPWDGGEGAVQVPAGIEVDLHDAVGNDVPVAWEATGARGAARITAWVHRQDIDQAWVVGSEPPERSHVDATLAGAIVDRPGGQPLAEPVHRTLLVEHTGEPQDGWWPVAWAGGGTRVDGWAYEDDLRPLDLWMGSASTGFSSRCGGVGMWARQDLVPRDTPLRTDPAGPVVARTLRPVVAPGFDAGGGWLSIDTPWGTAELFADPLDAPQAAP